jgi:hypothetical protein
MSETHNTPTQSSEAASTPVAVAHSIAKASAPSPDLADAIAKGYEAKDIGLRGIFVFLGVLAASLVVVFFVIYGIMMGILSYDRSGDPKASPLAVAPVTNTAPPLQPSYGKHDNLDLDDMKEMRQITEATLTSDQTTGPYHRHHIPIETAIDKTVTLLKPMIKTDVPATQPSIFTSDETTAKPVVSQR